MLDCCLESCDKPPNFDMSFWLLPGFDAVGGLMGYLKSGSQKSLLAGGLSAAILLYVFRELPTKPVLASTIGVGKEKDNPTASSSNHS